MASRLVLYSSDSSLSDDGERSPPPDDFNQKPGPSNEFPSRSNYHESHKRVVLDVHSSDSNPTSMQSDLSDKDLRIPDLKPVSAEEKPEIGDQCENAELSHLLPSSEAVQDDWRQSGAKRNAYALRVRDLPPGMRTFLAAIRKYFTQTVNLERQKSAVSETIYSKAEGRILCK